MNFVNKSLIDPDKYLSAQNILFIEAHSLNALDVIKTADVPKREILFLISNFRRVLNVVFFLLGDSPASEFRRRGITQKKGYSQKYCV
jgi:hypothetical protein